jgi:uncharacterized BrkB/YihY/UPF0761 family membrane protein
MAMTAYRRGEAARRALTRAPGYPVAATTVHRDRRFGGGLLAGALAFRLFGALLPLGLLVTVALGYAAAGNRGTADDVADALGIGRSVLESIAESSKLSTGTRWTVAAFGIVALLAAAVSAARAIRAAHSLAWTGGVERMRRPLWAALVLVAVLFVFAGVWWLLARARADLGAAGVVLSVVAAPVFFAVWLGVATLLPHGDAPWTALVPGAIVVGAGVQALHLLTVLFVAGRLERASAAYGSFGAALTILVWLYVLSRVIVASAMLNAELWQRRREARTAVAAALRRDPRGSAAPPCPAAPPAAGPLTPRD